MPIVADTVVETLDYKFKGPLVEIANDEDVELNLFHWVIDGKLFFQSTFRSKKYEFSDLPDDALFGSYYLITEHMSPDRISQIDFENRAGDSLPFEWMDGPSFLYQNKELYAVGSCQKDGDLYLKSGPDCPWYELDITNWKLEKDTFTVGAYRPLDEFYELKSGNAYSIVSGYIIQNGEELLAWLEPPVVNELIILDSISKAVAGIAFASSAIIMSMSF